MFDIADLTFSGVSNEDKQKYAGKIAEAGSFQGYKPRQYWVHVPGPIAVFRSQLILVYSI